MAQTVFFFLPMLISQLIGLVFGIVIIVGALQMMRLRSHGLATVASVLALLPCGPAWLLGLPMGIWSLVVLNRRDVKAAFQRREQGPAPDPRLPSDGAVATKDGKLKVQAPADGLILVGCAAFLTAVGVGIWLRAQWNAGLAPNTIFTLAGMSMTQAVYALFVVAGALLMRRLRFRILALLCVVIVGLFVPAVLALNVIMEFSHIPQWPVVIPMWLGVPVAVWATIVLFRGDVRAAFAERARPAQSTASAVSPERVSLWAGITGVILPALFLLAAVVLSSRLSVPDGFVPMCILLGVVLELVAIACGIATRRTPAGKAGLIIGSISLVLWLAALSTIHSRRGKAIGPQPESSTTGGDPNAVVFDTAGPALSPTSIESLELAPWQVAALNAVLRGYDPEYIDLEAKYIRREVIEEGRRVQVTVFPFQPDRDRLLRRFWRQVDAVLNEDHQRAKAKRLLPTDSLFPLGGERKQVFDISRTDIDGATDLEVVEVTESTRVKTDPATWLIRC